MRIVLEPLIGSSNLFGESDFLRHVTLARHASRLGHYTWFLVPDVGEIAQEMKEELEKIPNVNPLLVDTFKAAFYYNEGTTISNFGRMFNANFGEYPIDAVITSKSAVAAYEHRMLKDLRIEDLIPVIVLEPESYYPVFASDMLQSVVKHRVYGYAVGHTIFSTPFEQTLAIRMARKYLSFTSIKEILDWRSTIISTGINCDEIDEIIKDVKKHDKMTLFFGGRMNLSKKIEILLTEFEHLFSFAREVDFKMTTPSSPVTSLEFGKYKDFIDLKVGVRRTEFLRESAKAHILFYPSPHEGFPAGVWEQIYVGLIPVVRNCDWVRSQFTKDYPYAWDSVMEAKAMVRYIIDNYEKAYEETQPLRDLVREKYDANKTNPEILDFTNKVRKERSDHRLFKMAGRGNREMIRDAIDLMGKDEFTFEELTLAINKISPGYGLNKRQAQRVGRMGRTMLYQAMIGMGWRDKCDGPYPVFYKEDGDVIDYMLDDPDTSYEEEEEVDKEVEG